MTDDERLVEVREMMALYQNGLLSREEVLKRFGVSDEQIWQARENILLEGRIKAAKN